MRKFFKLRFSLLFVFLFVAGFLRFWHLKNNPPSLTWDEVALGYNAWSILHTGKDEYGNFLPLKFKSFDDDKQPVYVYLTAVSEAVFGLNEIGVRFPSAFLGALTVIFFYLLLDLLFKDKKISIIGTFLLAINPWHISFSRAAFETNVGVFFLIAGAYFLLKALKVPYFYLAATLFLSLSVYAYYTPRIVVFFILIAFLTVYWRDLIKSKKWVIVSLIFGLFLFFPLLFQLLFHKDSTRLGYLSIFTHQKKLAEDYAQEILNKNNNLWARIIYNRRVAYFWQFAENYLKSFSPDFLFVNGLDSGGLFYLWEVITIPLGFYLLWQEKNKNKLLIFSWFFSVPIVGGLSIGSPNAFRNLTNVPIFVIFSSLGLARILDCLKRNNLINRIFLSLFLLVFFFFLIRFLVLYFDYLPPRIALKWGDGYKQLAGTLENLQDKYDRILVTGRYWRPYIHLLFHLKYPPDKYLEEGGNNRCFANFLFGKAEWDLEGLDLGQVDLTKLKEGKMLVVLSPDEYNKQRDRGVDLKLIKTIDGKYVKEVFIILEI